MLLYVAIALDYVSMKLLFIAETEILAVLRRHFALREGLDDRLRKRLRLLNRFAERYPLCRVPLHCFAKGQFL